MKQLTLATLIASLFALSACQQPQNAAPPSEPVGTPTVEASAATVAETKADEAPPL